jgi:hypothetical protein
MKMNKHIFYLLCGVILLGGSSLWATIGSDRARFTLASGGRVRTPGVDGEIFSNNDIITSGEYASGRMPLPDFDGKDKIAIDALMVVGGKIIFSSDIDFQIGTNIYADEDLVEYNPVTGIYAMYLDGSAIGIPSDLDLDAATMNPDKDGIWFSVDGRFDGKQEYDVLEYDFISDTIYIQYAGTYLHIPDRSDIDALHCNRTNLYFSLTTTETMSGSIGRDEDVWNWNMMYGRFESNGLVTVLYTEVPADLNALDEWQDNDNDGLTDFEELTGVDEPSSTFGNAGTPLNPNGYHSNPSDFDTDDDGLNDGEEGIAGTDPNSSNSCLRITGITNAPSSGQIITWQSVSGRNYDIYATTNSGDSFFNCSTSSIAASAGTETSWTNTVNLNSPFFRVHINLN